MTSPHPDLPAAAIATAVRAGEVSAQEVVDAHLARIDLVNPGLNALTVVFADRAREAAALVDAAVAAGRDPGALAGVPVSVKENIDLTWSATTNGWRGLADAVPARDATIVRRVREAGAVPIGRGNMPDFGMRWDTDNDLFGRTLNPWDPHRSAGGSSGGDAVAVATGMSALGLGNDFGGSLRLPAYAVGAVGLRPSRGAVPRAAVGDHPVALTLQQFSVNGPIGRRVDDVALAFAVLRGWDADDPVSGAAPATPGEPLP
ncbi:amidase, partial [Microbacterium arthrosphaerae]